MFLRRKPRIGKRNKRTALTDYIECACGNGPLKPEDRAVGRQCTCCRLGHFIPHDFDHCIRCSIPVDRIDFSVQRRLKP